MKGCVSYERAPLCGYIYRSSHPHCNIILFILIQLLLNTLTILKWIIVYCPIYIGYLHSELGWFTTVVSERFSRALLLILPFGHKTSSQLRCPWQQFIGFWPTILHSEFL
jgi:hypothetical protein